MTKYKGITIENTPSEKYPNLVTITKTVKKGSKIQGKRFLTLDHAMKYVDDYLGVVVSTLLTEERLEKQEEKVARKELMKLNGIQFLTAVGK